MNSDKTPQFDNRVESFVDDINENFNHNLSLIEFEFYNNYGNDTALDPIRDEICKCLICDLCLAAITLTNHLLETFVKKILFNDDVIEKNKKSNSFSIEFESEFDNKPLWETLDLSKKRGLILDEEFEALMSYKNHFRNAYSHSENKKIFGSDKVKTQSIKIENGEFVLSEKRDALISNIIAGSGVFKVLKSKTDAFVYFKELDKIIRSVLIRNKEKKY